MFIPSALKRAALCVVLLTPLPAAAHDVVALYSIDTLAQTDPAAALAQTEAALGDPQVIGTPPDARMVHDLLELRAELLLDLGDLPRAAAALGELGAYRGQERDLLEADPVPPLRRAAEVFEDLGDLRQARRALELAIDAERGTGLGGERLASLNDALALLADLDGLTDIADAARAAAEAARHPPDGPADATRGGEEGGYRAIDVYYATDRARTGRDAPSEFYGGARGELELGVATVTIPNRHEPGQIEAPSIWRLQFGPTPSRHVILRSVAPVEADEYFARLRGEFSNDPRRDLVVCIHGDSVPFAASAKRAAQIAYDVGNSAVPVLYSWPSRGRTVGYIADTAVVRLSGRRLAEFLEELVLRSGAETIHIVAHSMGNRALTDALEIMALRRSAEPEITPLFGQVLFAAPDVDAQLFRAMAQTFRPLARRLTLYASEQDWALVSSRKLHGAEPRAGQGGDVLLSDPAFDSIDMSELGEDMLAHSYFADDSSALADMATLFWRDAPPARRCGITAREVEDGGPRWDYRAETCPPRDLIGVIAILREDNVITPLQAREVLPELTEDEDKINEIAPIIDQILAD